MHWSHEKNRKDELQLEITRRINLTESDFLSASAGIDVACAAESLYLYILHPSEAMTRRHN